LKTLLLYSLFLLPVICYSQIVYTDVIPDDTVDAFITNDNYNLDLNGDGSTDFIIKELDYTQSCGGPCPPTPAQKCVITPTAGNEIISVLTSGAKPLNLFDSINSNQTWSSDSNLNVIIVNPFCNTSTGYYCIPTGYGPFLLNTEHYAGLRVFIGGHYIYGWVRLYTIYFKTIIKDYAYNSVPDSFISAGNRTMGLAFLESSFHTFKIAPNPAHNQITISLNEFKVQSAELKVFDIMGQLVMEEKIYSPVSTFNFQLSSGVYFVKVGEGEKMAVQKLVIQ
jgi:hypothetical protein